MKIGKKLMVLGMCLCLAGCAAKDGQTEEKNTMIASGDIYEITENNFVKGMEHTFTEDELKIWNEAYGEGAFEEGEDVIAEDDIKYMINLYDEEENEIGEYVLDKNGNLYDGNKEGRVVYNDQIRKLLQKIIS